MFLRYSEMLVENRHFDLPVRYPLEFRQDHWHQKTSFSLSIVRRCLRHHRFSRLRMLLQRVTGGRTDRQTDRRITHDDIIYRANIASRGNNRRSRITKFGIEMFHHESWRAIYFVVERSRRHKKNSTGAFVSVVLFWLMLY